MIVNSKVEYHMFLITVKYLYQGDSIVPLRINVRHCT